MPETAYLDSPTNKHTSETVYLRIPALPAYVSVVRLAISAMASRCGFDIEAIEDIKVAIAEAVTNAVVHIDSELPEQVEIESSYDNLAQQLIIKVTDQGPGFDLQHIKTPEVEKLEAGGLGLFIIRSLMDEVSLNTKVGQGTSITMVKKLGVN